MAEQEKPASGSTEPAAAEVNIFDMDLHGIVDPESLDPDMHYRFVQNRPQRIARMRSRGYKVVSASEDGVKTLLEDEAADDTIRDGDTVLMATPKPRFEAGRKQLRKVTQGRLSSPKSQFRKKAKKAGPGGTEVTVVTTDKELK